MSHMSPKFYLVECLVDMSPHLIFQVVGQLTIKNEERIVSNILVPQI